jgi:type IV secretory pathway TraG/TraD family ATPase VirD4
MSLSILRTTAVALCSTPFKYQIDDSKVLALLIASVFHSGVLIGAVVAFTSYEQEANAFVTVGNTYSISNIGSNTACIYLVQARDQHVKNAG